MTDVRVRRHEETKQQIVAAALERFAERGFAEVTMEEIATAAGVSRRTVYRRFATKDEIVLELPRRWVRAWDDAVTAAGPDDARRDVAEAAAMAVATHIDDHAADVLVAYEALASTPSLAASGLATDAWIERIVGLLRADPNGATLDDAARRVIAGAYLGAIDSMMVHWAMTGGTGSVAASTRSLLDRLRPIWP